MKKNANISSFFFSPSVSFQSLDAHCSGQCAIYPKNILVHRIRRWFKWWWSKRVDESLALPWFGLFSSISLASEYFMQTRTHFHRLSEIISAFRTVWVVYFFFRHFSFDEFEQCTESTSRIDKRHMNWMRKHYTTNSEWGNVKLVFALCFAYFRLSHWRAIFKHRILGIE